MTVDQFLGERIKEIFGGDAFAGDVLVSEPMRDHTTIRIGGPADIYAMPGNLLSLKNLITALNGESISVMPLGGGSNILVSDEGIDGMVISTVSLNHVETIEESDEDVRLFVEAGTPLQKLVNLSRTQGYKGIEGLAGIPGFVGGAVRGNAGSFGYEMGDVVESVTVIDTGGRIFTIEKDDLGFGYRSSALAEGIILLSANIRLKKDDEHEVTKRVSGFLREKMEKQPISKFSAGCVFKNPPLAYAGRLIDESGCKGMRRGDVEVSSLHANFFVNRGNGKARDFLWLMEEVKERVIKSFGIELETEIKVVGR